MIPRALPVLVIAVGGVSAIPAGHVVAAAGAILAVGLAILGRWWRPAAVLAATVLVLQALSIAAHPLALAGVAAVLPAYLVLLDPVPPSHRGPAVIAVGSGVVAEAAAALAADTATGRAWPIVLGTVGAGVILAVVAPALRPAPSSPPATGSAPTDD